MFPVGYRNSVANSRKALFDRWIRMVAPSRLCPIGTRSPPFASPWPIYIRTIFPGSGELASKRGGGRGGSNFDSQIDGQITPKKRPSPQTTGKVKALSRFSFDLRLRIRSQEENPKKFEQLIDRLFEPLTSPFGTPPRRAWYGIWSSDKFHC